MLSRDSVLPECPERLTEVLERLVVLEHGIHLQSSGLSPEEVNSVITQELNKTRRSIELVLVPLEALRTTPLPKLTLLRRTSPHSVVSLTTVSSTTTSLCLRVVLWEPRRDQSFSESQSSHKPPTPLSRRWRSSSSIPLQRWVTVNSKLSKKKTSSSDLLPQRTEQNE